MNNHRNNFIGFIFLIVFCSAICAFVPVQHVRRWQLAQNPKFSALMREELQSVAFTSASNDEIKYDILVFLQDHVRVADFKSVKNVDTRAMLLTTSLMHRAKMSQQPLLSMISKYPGVQVYPYWISNCIAVLDCPLSLVEQLAHSEAVREIQYNGAIKNFARNEYEISLSEFSRLSATTQRDMLYRTGDNGVEWNVDWIEATKLWAKGFRGEGITIGIADTGVQWDHPALKKHYRGFDATTNNTNHNYNWWDGIRTPVSGGSKCGYAVKTPCDDYGHGTHCTGTTSGGTDERQIGVAPGARWIGCRNMDAGNGRPHTYIDCLQFMMAPTDLDGKNPDPSRRPHIVSNSYGCEPSEKCEPNSLKDATDAIVAAGVFMSVAAGNSGPRCSSVSSGPGIYESSFSIGALGFKSNDIAGFSSRGPVTSDHSDRTKPNLCAPGVNVVSSYPPNTYVALSGTSMATPNVAGGVALLWNAVPSLQRNIERTIQILEKSAFGKTSTQCANSTQVPNNVYGFGVIRLEKAYEMAKN